MSVRKNFVLGLFVIATVCTAAASTAQSSLELRGRLTDAISGQPVSNAIVRVPALGKYTLTNPDGRFALQGVARGINTIVVVNLGYVEATMRLDVQADGFHELSIEPKPI